MRAVTLPLYIFVLPHCALLGIYVLNIANLFRDVFRSTKRETESATPSFSSMMKVRIQLVNVSREDKAHTLILCRPYITLV